jgi:outer membrane immunogenic protein
MKRFSPTLVIAVGGGNVFREQDSAGRHHGGMTKKLIASAAIAALIGTRALAADMEVNAPLPPAPVHSWTGFYVGGNIGYSWGNADTDFNAGPVTVRTDFGLPTIPGFVSSESVKPKGIIGGGQIGYNWQFSANLVAGLEADMQGSGEKASTSFSDPFSVLVSPRGPFLFPPPPRIRVTGTAVTDYEANISWFGTVRGRIGYAWKWVMLYATGGLAYGEVKLQGTHTVSGSDAVTFSIGSAIAHSQVNTGWTVGAVVEAALFGNWTWKAEYLYVDLGSLDTPPGNPTVICTICLPPSFAGGGQIATHTHFTDNIARVGLNYKFY